MAHPPTGAANRFNPIAINGLGQYRNKEIADLGNHFARKSLFFIENSGTSSYAQTSIASTDFAINATSPICYSIWRAMADFPKKLSQASVVTTIYRHQCITLRLSTKS
jgi:hypothetical protein